MSVDGRRLRESEMGRLGTLWLACAGLCILGVVVSVIVLNPTPRSGGLVLILLGCSFAAELFAVNYTAHRLRLAFTPPFIAIAAGFLGALPALVIDVLVTAGGTWLRSGSRTAESRLALLNNVLVSAASVGAGAAVMTASAATDLAMGEQSLSILTFLSGYLVSNALLTRALSDPRQTRRLAQLAPEIGLPALVVLLAFCSVAVIGAFALQRGAWPELLLLFAPLIMVRMALSRHAELQEQYSQSFQAIVSMLQEAHPGTHSHLQRLGPVAEEIALRLGLSPSRARKVREAAVLHDIGKIAIDERILDKPGRLTPEEYEHVKAHARLGAKILEPYPMFRDIGRWILLHHERIDGAGYPTGIKGDQIPIESRIIAVVDAYDAMCGMEEVGAVRPYRRNVTHEEAIVELKRFAGTQFDEAVVVQLAELMEENRAH